MPPAAEKAPNSKHAARRHGHVLIITEIPAADVRVSVTDEQKSLKAELKTMIHIRIVAKSAKAISWHLVPPKLMCRSDRAMRSAGWHADTGFRQKFSVSGHGKH